MGKTRVLIDIFYLYVAQTGIRTYTESLVEAINNSSSEEFEYMISPDYGKIKSSTFFKGKTPKWKNLLFQGLYLLRKALVLPLLSYRYKSDIVFSPDILSPLWARGQKVSVIHDAFFWENSSHYNPLWLRYYLGMLRLSLSRNGQVVTITHYSKQQIQRYLDMPHLAIHVVYPASNIVAKGPPKEEAIISSPYFLHVGVMEKRKNLVTLVRAFARFVAEDGFKDYKLVLVGQRGPRKELDDYDHIIKEINVLDIQEKVILPGFVSKSELDNYYSHAKVYLFPSLSEGFGMPILEAFSYGIPVITSRQGALMEVGGNAVICPLDNSPAAFTEEMKRVVENRELREGLVKKGSHRLAGFGGKQFLQSLESCFSKMTS